MIRKMLIIKKGRRRSAYHKDFVFIVPAFLLETVFDPTGAGDTFADRLTDRTEYWTGITPNSIPGKHLIPP